MYLWIKALHVIAIISWMAGLLYLPRLFVYHAGVGPGAQSETVQDDGAQTAAFHHDSRDVAVLDHRRDSGRAGRAFSCDLVSLEDAGGRAADRRSFL